MSESVPDIIGITTAFALPDPDKRDVAQGCFLDPRGLLFRRRRETYQGDPATWTWSLDGYPPCGVDYGKGWRSYGGQLDKRAAAFVRDGEPWFVVGDAGTYQVLKPTPPEKRKGKAWHQCPPVPLKWGNAFARDLPARTEVDAAAELVGGWVTLFSGERYCIVPLVGTENVPEKFRVTFKNLAPAVHVQAALPEPDPIDPQFKPTHKLCVHDGKIWQSLGWTCEKDADGNYKWGTFTIHGPSGLG
ncbi:hypothetical protein [Streptomyces sp. YGL11-2]|uniref:hypothetical protein n=1 Tax=Streptomyces sp. YGL11-2 TaxID=3414028 RepID=UPI003CEA0557